MGQRIKVIDVEAIVKPTPPATPVIVCHLEDGREFVLYNVPYDIVRSINKLRGLDFRRNKPRESVFDLLQYFKSVTEEMGRMIEKVVIDELDPETGLYTAKLYVNLEGKMKMVIPMIPSHAIYLALVTDKPIYVDEDLMEEEDLEGFPPF
ncbi:hypothetical protein IPA_08675 [Ignicoccus pacificus DSM 13166]|uniref:BFN domain-containing protein n=1 Tax=Ignicoccus pacificus DSM 13166 TaxID=940294 RepID=A0A977PKV5_9CREN|nr:hypothetical protein IPA_08675 [Ignicoccus pacificus DSM 13166]